MDGIGEMVMDGSVVKEIHHGLPKRQRSSILAASDQEVNSFIVEWSGKSLWALWAAGPLQRYCITHWATGSAPMASLARFLLRVERIGRDAAESAAICDSLASDSGAPAAAAAAKTALNALVAATRGAVFTDGFIDALSPVLDALDVAKVTCSASMFSDRECISELITYLQAAARPVREQDFTGQRMLGVGGFGMVMCAFKNDTGHAYALKRQNALQVI